MIFPRLVALATAPPQVAGAEAEQPQYARARAAFDLALLGQPVGNKNLSGRLTRRAKVDLRSPQIFVTHPAIRQAVDGSPIGGINAVPHLPGRQAAVGWDGENGPASPLAGLL